MPQAPTYLRERWHDDRCAFDQIKGHFRIARGGIIYPIEGYTPTADDNSAIDYLFLEWDFGYSATRPDTSKGGAA